MAIKKSELYSSLWASCDELRGGMDASQYKDYVLVLLFIKYVSDKATNDPNALIEVPKGGSFKDMVALKHSKDIGDGINKIIGELAKKNDLAGVIDVADFNDNEKLGSGKEMVDRLTNLVSIFENPALDFSKNRAEGDDILGDAYEYLMRHFATESGKSKGQFYTPSEVSRVIAKVLNIKGTNSQTTFYDPTCGSGSLLLKAIDEADGKGSIYGQEKEFATAALAKMNMILHGQEAVEIKRGKSTLSDPEFKDKHGHLKTFDFVVANPPFSSKNWTNGFDPNNDLFGRFEEDEDTSKKTGKKSYKIPPAKNGDYAFLLHIIKSLKSTGKGACILPHGVLFRGNAEAEIRKSLVQRGYIKGIIGMPPNLFYGTGIPACIIVIDKEYAEAQMKLSDAKRGIFMIDASKGFIKDGNKNRLREQDIHKIVDVFNKQLEVPKYSRFVSLKEIADPKNEYNLNLPRYIDSQEAEDIQDIEAHLLGGIPNADIEALDKYWAVYPTLKATLFKANKRKNYKDLKITNAEINQTIYSHDEFKTYNATMSNVFEDWRKRNTDYLRTLTTRSKPKKVIHQIAEDILKSYTDKALIDKYDVYQHLMDYWGDIMQDDVYLIAVDGWKAETYRILVTNKKGKETDKGWTCDLVPPTLIIDRYFANKKKAIEALEAQRDSIEAKIEEMTEEHSAEEGYFADFDKVNKKAVNERLKEIKKDKTAKEEREILEAFIELTEEQSELNRQIKVAETELDKAVYEKYPTLSEKQIKELVVENKWMAFIESRISGEMHRISQTLTTRIKELAERYDIPLPKLVSDTLLMEGKVTAHLKKMGYSWN